MQKPAFNVVPASQSSKLACKCATCKPLAGFPPVCTECKCQEALDDAGEPKPDVFILGHTKACGEDKCKELGEEEGAEPDENKFNALLDFPECEWWSCYDKEGWFCACSCPGQGCI
jgi:hypothetical protein